MSDRMIWMVLKRSNRQLKGATLCRSDTEAIRIVVSDPDQTGATLRFVARPNPNPFESPPTIIKSGADFTIVVSDTGNLLQAEFVINPADTVAIAVRTTLTYDLERNINGNIQTLERGVFTVDPDIARN